jgi:uncharacterized membrane protein YbhN (UPF0104 family)
MSHGTDAPRGGWRRHLAWFLPLAYYLLVAGFLAALLTTIDWATLARLRPEIGWVALATLTGLAGRALMVVAWLVILRGLGAPHDLDVPALTLVYAKSWLGRYVPGSAPWILGKIYFASRQGLSVRKLTTASLLEGGLQALVMLVVGLVLMVVVPGAAPLPGWLLAAMIAGALVGAVVLLPPVFNRGMQLAARLLRREALPSDDLPGYRTVGAGAALYAVAALVNGGSLFFIARALNPELPAEVFLYCVGALAVSAAVGMLAVFAPGGLGVREAILVVLLSAVMPTEVALATAVVTRVWSIGVDLLFLGLAATGARIRRGSTREPDLTGRGRDR